MAYAQTQPVFSDPVRISRDRVRRTITFSESDGAVASEWVVNGLPPQFDLVEYVSTKTAGTGATIGPYDLGNASGFTLGTNAHLFTTSISAHATFQHERHAPALTLDCSSRKLYGRTKPASGTNNVYDTKLVIDYAS